MHSADMSINTDGAIEDSLPKQPNVLAEIVKHKESEVEIRKANLPLELLKKDLQPSARSFYDALSNQHSDFIFECKKASPSKGLIRANFDIEEILFEYAPYASAISVLTDNRYFQGDFSYLKKASELVKQPLLCKDFFIETYQVYEARYYGADAILLMLSVLDDATYKKLAKVARELNLDILTEVHDEAELKRALNLDAKIIGINNRDLKSLKIDLATTEKLAKQINKDCLIIAESGIETHQDIKRLAPLVDGFLVGSSIMAKHDMREQCKALIYGQVKVCGLTQPNDAIAVDDNGGIFGGLMFYPKSKRYIDLETAKQTVKAASLKYIGVFVNEDIELVMKYATSLNLFAIQLHGDESAEYIAELRARLNQSFSSHIQIWKAERINHQVQYSPNPDVDRYLFDAYSEADYGGNGESFDWRLLKNINSAQIMLAGGITPDNAKRAMNLDVYGIDLSSGVENQPGQKCYKKIESLFKQLRA